MIHPTAIIHPGASLGNNVSVGAYSIIGEHVEIGDDNIIDAHVVITGHTRIGNGNHIFHFSALGDVPQDKKYSGEPTRLEIGDRNTIREFCTFNTGTVQDAGITKVGSDNWIMAYVHIAHDCQIGSNTIFSNNAQIAGHVHVGDWAILGGFSGVHQFCHIGVHAMIGATSLVTQDVPPFVLAAGNTASPYGLNVEGLKRRGFDSNVIAALKNAYRVLYKSGLTLDEAQKQLVEIGKNQPEVQLFVNFLLSSKRGIIR